MKFAIRQLLKTPGFTVVALVILALGIGVNTTAFTALNRLILRPLPFAETGRLVELNDTEADGSVNPLSPADYCDIRDQNTVFEHFAAFGVTWMSTLVEPGRPAIRVDSMFATADFFATLGIQPVMLGRSFTPDEERLKQHVALLSHAFWVSHYGADPCVLGQVLHSDGGVQYSIIGVMVPALDDPTLFGRYINGVAFCSLINDIGTYRDRGWNSVAARLKPGVTTAQAKSDLTLIAKRLTHDYPKTNTGRAFRLSPFPTDALDDTARNLVWLVMGLAGVVLLVACVNLANLQLVRATSRGREFAIRMALGCSRLSLIGMLLTESLLLSAAGGAVGLLLAQWSSRFLAAYWHVDMPLNFRILLFAFLASASCGAFFGTLPAWFCSRGEVNFALKRRARGASSDRSRHRLRAILIVAELAMALVLLTGAGYFVRGIQRITHRNLGWDPANVVFGYMALDHDHYGEFRDPRNLALGARLLVELGTLPNVESFALSNENPFSINKAPFAIEGRPPLGPDATAYYETPSPGYFATYGMRVLEGRDFLDSDRPGAPKVVIISEEMARRYWPHESPIGKRVGWDNPKDPEWCEVVGVVNDITHHTDFDGAGGHLAIYRPWAQNSFRYFAISLKSRAVAQTTEELRKAMAKLEPNIAFSYLGSADDMASENLMQYSVVQRMLLLIAGLGLLLSAVGLYGVIANLAAERNREVGIRMALGAQASDVLRLFLGNSITLAATGVGLGIFGSFALVRALDHWIATFPGDDPRVILALAFLLVCVSALASWLPAHKATRIDPVRALASE